MNVVFLDNNFILPVINFDLGTKKCCKAYKKKGKHCKKCPKLSSASTQSPSTSLGKFSC